MHLINHAFQQMHLLAQSPELVTRSSCLGRLMLNGRDILCLPHIAPEDLTWTIMVLHDRSSVEKINIMFGLGNAHIADELPDLLEAVIPYKQNIAVLCKPVTQDTPLGEAKKEIHQFVVLCHDKNIIPAGIKLDINAIQDDTEEELTPQTLCGAMLTVPQANELTNRYIGTRSAFKP